MNLLTWMLVVFQGIPLFCGKHIPIKNGSKGKTYPRQMIIPNKFIPMLKGSALFKSRSSTNDLSNFLRPKSHESVAGQTRQNLMNAMGMDNGPSQEEGDVGPGGMGAGALEPGGMGPSLGGSEGDIEGGLPGLAAMTGSNGMSGSEGGGLEGLPKVSDTGGINDQMNGMNGGVNGGMNDGLPSPEVGANPLEGQMGGNNAMNPMNNAAPEGMMSDSNSLPAGDPMGTLKAMLDTQGTNGALGANGEVFGPGGSANSNVLAMLNQIVGKEMPGESPIDPTSKSQEMWDQLQKGFSNQRAALQSVQPYIDANEHKNPSAPTQQVVPSNNSTSSQNPATSSSSQSSNETTPAPKQPVYNLTFIKSASSKKLITSDQPTGSAMNSVQVTEAPGPMVSLPSTKAMVSIHSHMENNMTSTTVSPAEIEMDDDQPLSDDMVKFLKGIKFVVSQKPGNNIILGKKFSGPVSMPMREENGVMKNSVSEEIGNIKFNKENQQEAEAKATIDVLKGIDLSYAKNLLLRRNVKSENFSEYKKAAKLLKRASRKLRDPIAKKSTEIAISSILKVLELQKKKKKSPRPTIGSLTGGDVKSALAERYFEAARVLGTASKKLADPVAKRSAEIGIAAILKVIVLDASYSMSKKDLVPLSYYPDNFFKKYFYRPLENQKINLPAAQEIAHKL